MLYDTVLQKHSNLTEDLDTKFYDSNSGDMDNPNPFGSPGWTEHEKYVIIYDEFDIWFIKPDQSQKLKITNGKLNNKSYRINLENFRDNLEWINKHSESLGAEFPTNNLVLNFKQNNEIEGLSIINDNLQLINIYQGPYSLKNITTTPKLDKIGFVRSNYYSPPSVYLFDREYSKISDIYVNKKHFNSSYTTIKFSHSDNTLGNAKLLYPENFDPAKKYPMIVWIYQDMTRKFKEFQPPSLLNPDGFNILWYLNNDYFVLLPDIKYEDMNPGISALNSVNAAVDETFKFQFINKDKIGLIGHSFGGYESLFIATHSDKFATIVAGNPVSDLQTFYYNISWQFNYEEFWRVQHNQHKMIKSPVEIPQNYHNNSPMQFVQNIKNPVLLWAGKNDKNVNWNESLQFYLAMRRYNKEGEFVIFEDEEHLIDKASNQLYLNNRIFNWFNLYLK